MVNANSQTGNWVAMAIRNASGPGSAPPTQASTILITPTLTRAAMKPPTITRPDPMPIRCGGTKLRLMSKAMLEAGKQDAKPIISTTSKGMGALPGHNRTAVQATTVKAATIRASATRWFSKMRVSTPIGGPAAIPAITKTVNRFPAWASVRPWPWVRNGNPHMKVKINGK